ARGLAGVLGVVGAGLGSLAGCGDDDGGGQNVLPTASASGTGSASGTTAGEASTAGPDTDADATADTTAGPSASLPATYRFDCIDVGQRGDGNGDGERDGEAFQAMLLENTWAADIDAHKLNVMLTVRSRDDGAGSAELLIGSGIGPSDDDLCTEPTT